MIDPLKIVRPHDPEFKKLMEEGKIVAGADVEAEMARIKGEDHPGSDDEVVQPKTKK